jgi:hypothetical protein
MCVWVGQLVFFVISLFDVDEYAQVVLAGADADACAGELCGELVEAAGCDATFGAVDVEG